eukprot:NODE_2090_length_997_cov_161.807856.p1 GENE.NODE_2090_length_997_cov_161.807856~~NODE_2090_length_997_cov_161.807856.p1  ORF type:complete len:248 (+),score=58.93 NODE_2090_length_997_cov_161.807856:220-963(+)
MERFGGLDKAMYTLYVSALGGQDWNDVCEPLFEMSFLLGMFFILFVAFAALCVLNVVTGLFVHKATCLLQADADMRQIEDVALRESQLQQIATLFIEVDEGGRGLVTAEEFCAYVSNDGVQTCLRLLGLDIDEINAKSVFHHIDFDHAGQLEHAELVWRLANLSGVARQLTVASIERKLMTLQKNNKATEARPRTTAQHKSGQPEHPVTTNAPSTRVFAWEPGSDLNWAPLPGCCPSPPHSLPHESH